MKSNTSDEIELFWMQKALFFADLASAIDEVPVGAIIIKNDVMIGWGYNRREVDRLAIRHAEMDAIAMASKALGSWRLLDCTLYVTLEPCIMCAGALVQARIPRVVFGTRDPKAGAMGSLYSVHNDMRLNHQIIVSEGLLATQSGEILRDFFQKRRKKRISP